VSPPASAPRYPWKESPGSSHLLLLERVANRGDRLALLDLGFGSGELARRVRPRCRYLAGIDADAEAARAAEGILDAVHVGDLAEGLSRRWAFPFDVIVAGDILEHLPCPEELMAPIRSLLAPGGRLLLSLPNVANVTTRLALLAGRFEYVDRGILDRTHLRFFTLKSSRALLASSGFRIVGEWATPMPVELAVPAFARPPLLGPGRAVSSALGRLAPGLFGYQLVFEAEPA
jgi:2-polyprenyl-3-methyl-5-hydroxy-6-metoxy-1,4-benzoquinol methylase